MSAIPIAIADAVASMLNQAIQSSAIGALTADEETRIVAQRSYPIWDDDFKLLNDLQIDVVFVSSGANSGDQAELDSALSFQTETAIDIAVRQRFEPQDQEPDGQLKTAVVDRLIQLVEDLFVYLIGQRDTALNITGLSANWYDATIRTYCDYKRLREGCFLGVVRVRYSASKAV